MIPIQQLRQANTNNIGLCLRNDIVGFSIQENPNDNLETITKIYFKNIDDFENHFDFIHRVGCFTGIRYK